VAVTSTRTIAALALLVALLTGTVTGCTPEPEPSATPEPPFASDEEAFAAAEEAYRAYIDAVNQVDLSDPKTFEPLLEFSAEGYAAREREDLSQMHAEGYVQTGDIVLVWFRGGSVDGNGSVTARSCENLSGTSINDAEGNSLVDPARPPSLALDVKFMFTRENLKIVSAEPVEDPSCLAE
jgi:hypothetical protein